MSLYQPFKKVDRRCLNFLNEEKPKKKHNLNYFPLHGSSVREDMAFFLQKGLEMRMHTSKEMPVQHKEAKA